jgi:lycopene cyclase domain-containing protein
MNGHYTYLLINLCTVFFPLALSFDKRVRFFKNWRYLLPGIIITALFFLAWDVIFTLNGVWSFNRNKIIGLYFFRLPLEEVLFFFTVPFACVFIYACLNYYIKWQLPQKAVNVTSALLFMACLAALFVFRGRLYTMVTFGVLFLLICLAHYIFKAHWLSRFYRAYLVVLLPFFVVNGILTGVPVVLYNSTGNMNIRIGTIPLEDFFYLMALLLMNVGFFESFKSSNQTT